MLVSLHYKYKLRPCAPYATGDRCLTLSLRSGPEHGLSRPPPFPFFSFSPSSPSPSSSSFPFPSRPKHLSHFAICENRWCFKALKIFNLHFSYFTKLKRPIFLNIFPFSMTWHLFAVFSFLALWCHHLPGNPTCGSAFQALVFPGCGWAITADFRATLANLELPLLSWLPILHVDSASFTSFWGSGENNPIQNQFVSCIDSQSWDLSCHQVNSQLHEEKLSPTLQSPKKIKPAS